MLGKLKEKLTNFFSPVKGGHLDGYTFKKFLMSFQRIGVFSIILSFLFIGIFSDKESFVEPFRYYGVIGFFSFILILFIFKSLQHWNDLKNHTSR